MGRRPCHRPGRRLGLHRRGGLAHLPLSGAHERPADRDDRRRGVAGLLPAAGAQPLAQQFHGPAPGPQRLAVQGRLLPVAARRAGPAVAVHRRPRRRRLSRRRPESAVRRQQHPRSDRNRRLRRRPRPAAQVVRRRGVRHPHRLDGDHAVRLSEDGEVPQVRPRVPRQLQSGGRSAGGRARRHHRLHLPQLPLPRRAGQGAAGQRARPAQQPALRADGVGADRGGQGVQHRRPRAGRQVSLRPALDRPGEVPPQRGRLQVPGEAAERLHADELHQAAHRPVGRDDRDLLRQDLRPAQGERPALR